VPVCDKDHGRVPVAPPVALGRFHKPFDLGLGEVLPPAQLGVSDAASAELFVLRWLA